MPVKPRSVLMPALAAAGCLLLAGCATQVTGESPASGRREGARPAAVEKPPAAAAATSAVEDGDTPQDGDTPETSESTDAVAALVAERRRSDFPSIEIQPSGFTITEQVRIGGNARADYDRALGLLKQERYAEGIPILVALTEATPGVTAPYIDLGIAYEHTGDLERAEEVLKKAELLSPGNPVVENELGIVYRKTGRFADAKASYEKALAVFDGFHFARRNLGILCDLYLGDLDCALENYKAYLASVGSDSEVEKWIADLENRIAN